MIKAIIFDFVQTLGTAADGYKDAEKNSQVRLYEKLGISCWNEYMDLYREERKQHFLRSDFSRKNVWIAIYNHFEIPVDHEFTNQLEDEYWGIVKQSMKLFPEAYDVLKELKGKYKLGMISNSSKDGSTRALQNDEYKKMEVLFDAIIISGEGDIPAKPDSAPFRMMLKSLGVTPDEAIFVGDDFRVDIEGAANVGIKPVWLKHHSVERNWPEAAFKVPEITDLREVLDIEKKI